jgi:formylglycine-generating enzyme required for sulfatase activity
MKVGRGLMLCSVVGLAFGATAASCDDGKPRVPDDAALLAGAGAVTAGHAGMTVAAAGSASSDAGTDAESPPDAAVQGMLEPVPADPFDAGDCTAPTPTANCTDGWCKIPAGCFVMGSPEDAWGHPAYQEDQVAVTLAHAFLIQQTEVTLDQWTNAGLPSPPNTADGGGDCMEPTCPVANVSWFDAVAYANLLSQTHEPPLSDCYELQGCVGQLGNGLNCQVTTTTPTIYGCEGFRLPSDAEWEYAARAGTTTSFYSGPMTEYGDWLQNFSICNPDPNLEKIGWYCWNSNGTTQPARGLAPNAFGLYDMAGNVGEWINDRSDGAGAQAPVDPDGRVDNHPTRNVRGGWFSSEAWTCRMPTQSGFNWAAFYPGLGFRLVRNLNPSP